MVHNHLFYDFLIFLAVISRGFSRKYKKLVKYALLYEAPYENKRILIPWSQIYRSIMLLRLCLIFRTFTVSMLIVVMLIKKISVWHFTQIGFFLLRTCTYENKIQLHQHIKRNVIKHSLMRKIFKTLLFRKKSLPNWEE